MTWVIGRAGPFGHAVSLSDIRVTLRNGVEKDCLQKVYRLGPQIVLGFAGSVAIGFEIVRQLSTILNIEDKGSAWKPKYVAKMLPIGTRKLFQLFPDEEKSLGCDLMLLGAYPTENDGPTSWAKCYVYRFFSPDFEPVLAGNGEIVSIGSGSCVKPYVEALDKLENNFDMFKLELGMSGGSGIGLMASVSSVLKNITVSGISRHLQICIVGRENIQIGANNIDMPPVARNMQELEQVLSSSQSVQRAKC